MTPVKICGFECGITAPQAVGAGSHWPGSSGTPAIDTSVYAPNGGAASLLIDTIGASATKRLQHELPSVNDLVVAFYVRRTTSPSGTISIANANSSTNAWHIGINTSGVIRAVVHTGTVVFGPTLTQNQWYRIDAYYKSNGTTGTIDWQVDGDAQDQATGAITANPFTNFRFGMTSSAEALFRLDDLIISQTAGDYPIGEKGVVGFVPTACGTHSFTAGDFRDETNTNLGTTETASWARVSTVPAVTTTHVRQGVIRAAGYLEYAFASAPGGKTPYGVEVIASVHNVGTGANTQKTVLYDGTSAADVYALASSGSSAGAIRNHTGVFPTKPSGGAWTNGAFNAMRARWGYSTDITDNPALDLLVVEAAFDVGVAEQEAEPALISQAGAATAPSQITQKVMV